VFAGALASIAMGLVVSLKKKGQRRGSFQADQ
jgi:hypothetical protein